MTIEEIAFKEYEKVGDEKLFPNHTDKDIWVAGFKEGYLLAQSKITVFMIDKLKEVYERINNEFLSQSPLGPYNSKEFRADFKQRLENEFNNNCIIKCDEENNCPDIIYSCCLVARVSWVDSNKDKYCNLIFGQPNQIMVIKNKYNL